MSNPMWVAGANSPNPKGRPKHSARTVKGMVERFIKRNITPNKLQKMFDSLTNLQKLEMLMQLLPYAAAKQTPESLGATDVDKLYDEIMEALKSGKVGKAS